MDELGSMEAWLCPRFALPERKRSGIVSEAIGSAWNRASWKKAVWERDGSASFQFGSVQFWSGSAQIRNQIPPSPKSKPPQAPPTCLATTTTNITNHHSSLFFDTADILDDPKTDSGVYLVLEVRKEQMGLVCTGSNWSFDGFVGQNFAESYELAAEFDAGRGIGRKECTDRCWSRWVRGWGRAWGGVVIVIRFFVFL